jgi:hypothetical protein
MPVKIKISIGEVTVYAELLDTACAQAIAKSLPIEARPNVWGDEFYFTIQVNMPLDETATTRIAVGDIGFWPPGNTGFHFSLFTGFWSLLAAWHILVNKGFLFCAVEGYEGMATP